MLVVVASCKVTVAPVRILTYEPELGCHVSRIVGYRAKCSRHGRMSTRATLRLARADAKEHRAR
jgi:hypothetical protein